MEDVIARESLRDNFDQIIGIFYRKQSVHPVLSIILIGGTNVAECHGIRRGSNSGIRESHHFQPLPRVHGLETPIKSEYFGCVTTYKSDLS